MLDIDRSHRTGQQAATVFNNVSVSHQPDLLSPEQMGGFENVKFEGDHDIKYVRTDTQHSHYKIMYNDLSLFINCRWFVGVNIHQMI